MKRYILIFLCLITFNYSNPNVAQLRTTLKKVFYASKTHWSRYRELHAHQEAFHRILTCPRQRETYVQQLEVVRFELEYYRKMIEQEYPHLKPNSKK